MSERDDDIVGHKTFRNGEKVWHEPLTRAEGEAFWSAAMARKAKREADMPDDKAAIEAMFQAHERLRELGWRDAIYCPKDGSHFQVIEPGSTGIFDGWYEGEWPKGSWWAADADDIYPSHPVLFRLYPEDQAKEDARLAEAKARYAARPSPTKDGV